MDNSNTRGIGNQNQQNFTNNLNMTQPPNYMSYAFGGSYDENQYSQYAPGDYNTGPSVQQPVSPPKAQPNIDQNGGRFPPKTFTDTNGGRAPDTQSAIRPTSSRDWRAGSSFPSEQKSVGNPLSRFQQEPKDSHLPAFEVIGNSGRNKISAKGSYYSCPECGELAVRVLDNANRDALCRNGHTWRGRQAPPNPPE